jgi:HlyD family secretion protein
VHGGALSGKSEPVAAAPAAPGGPAGIACLGRIEPKDGIVTVAARALAGEPSVVGELRVHEGDLVKAGQIIAVLDSYRELESTVQSLNAEVAVAESRVAVAKTGPRKGDVAAQEAEIARLEAVLADARVDAARYEQLYDRKAATAVERDQRRLQVATATKAIDEARSRLASLQEVRDVDVKLAEAGVQSAKAAVARAETEMAPATVRAPFTGRVLKIDASAGEEVGPKGILEMASTDRMYVIAEVFETDVARARVGEKASIASEAFPDSLSGTVESIGSQVAAGQTAPTSPVSFSDTRVVEVKIRLDDSGRASHMIHGKVNVSIQP